MPINHYLNRYRYLYRGPTIAGCCKASCPRLALFAPPKIRNFV